jgi:hypothetical protein
VLKLRRGPRFSLDFWPPQKSKSRWGRHWQLRRRGGTQLRGGRCHGAPHGKGFESSWGRQPSAKARAAEMIELAELPLRNLATPAVSTRKRLLEAESENVQLVAANSALDRGLGKATTKVELASEITVKRPW